MYIILTLISLFNPWQVTWRKMTQPHPLTIGLYTFVGDTRIGVDYNQRTNEWSLIIQDVRPNDEGIYSCAISTKQESSTYDIKLNVKSQYSLYAIIYIHRVLGVDFLFIMVGWKGKHFSNYHVLFSGISMWESLEHNSEAIVLCTMNARPKYNVILNYSWTKCSNLHQNDNGIFKMSYTITTKKLHVIVWIFIKAHRHYKRCSTI